MGRTQSLQDIYLTMTDMDKTAGQGGSQSASADDLAVAEQVAEQIAAAEAAELESGYDKTASADDEGGLADNEFVKQAAELDAAGRIMARGFFIACHEAMIEAMSLDQKIAYYTDEMTRSVMRAYRNAKDEALAPLRRHIAALRRIHRATTLK